jgi:hypothetical protein
MSQSNALAIVGAIIGGVLGYFLFQWLLSHGLYGMIIPGGLLGVGASFAKSRSLAIAIVCGVAALALGLYCEWRFFPFNADEGLSYFLTHLHQVNPVHIVMILAGAAIGFWGPFRHRLAR